MTGFKNNGYGQLGDSTTNNSRVVPVQITAGVQSIAAGHLHTLILKTDTLFACGGNWNGQLGDSTMTDRHYPVQITTDVQSIAAGSYHSLIVKTNETVWTCGENAYGQLGNGTTASYQETLGQINF
jgi:alpha-tubulin suppressor-like RCC1 family protein